MQFPNNCPIVRRKAHNVYFFQTLTDMSLLTRPAPLLGRIRYGYLCSLTVFILSQSPCCYKVLTNSIYHKPKKETYFVDEFFTLEIYHRLK